MPFDESPPSGYVQPQIIWMVEEELAPRPDDDSDVPVIQRGAFLSEAEAQLLKERLEADKRWGLLRINVVAVHQTVRDWEWDR